RRAPTTIVYAVVRVALSSPRSKHHAQRRLDPHAQQRLDHSCAWQIQASFSEEQ
ncbi:Hypothetical predicted protein, partial [Olea europaea subsp. europaea]